MSNLIDTVRGIEKWFFDNGLETESPNATLKKITETLNKTKSYASDSDRRRVMLGIGGVGVLLITLAEQYGVSFEACLERAFEVVKDTEL